MVVLAKVGQDKVLMVVIRLLKGQHLLVVVVVAMVIPVMALRGVLVGVEQEDSHLRAVQGLQVKVTLEGVVMVLV